MLACNQSEGRPGTRTCELACAVRKETCPSPPLTQQESGIHHEDGSAENGQQSAQHDRPRSFKLTIFLWLYASWRSNNVSTILLRKVRSYQIFNLHIHHNSIENLPQSPSVWFRRYQTHNEDPLLSSLHSTEMANPKNNYQPLCPRTIHHRRRLGLIWNRISRPVSHQTMARRIRSRLE